MTTKTTDHEPMRVRGAWVLMPIRITDADEMVYHREGFGMKEVMPLDEWYQLSEYHP